MPCSPAAQTTARRCGYLRPRLPRQASRATRPTGKLVPTRENHDASIVACTNIIDAGIDTSNNLALAYYKRGEAYGGKGDFGRALADFNKAIELNPDYAEAYGERGAAYGAKGDYGQAIADLDKAIQLKPDYVDAYVGRGDVYKFKGDFGRALADFNTAIQLKPDDANAYYVRALLYRSNNDMAKALDDFRAAARLIPEGDKLHGETLARIAEIEARQVPSTPSPAPSPSLPSAAPIFTGTGIVVSGQGQVLTNNHVIDGCQKIEIRRTDDVFRPALLLYADKTNDLALLKIDAQVADKDVAAIRTSPPVRAGEEIAVYGFPLAGALSSTGNIVGGNVSALAGLGDDIRLMQVTAPIQPGNSGGPLLDQSGNVVGIVQSKLDEMKEMQGAGVFPQNVNFAIKASVATSFLEAHSVGYQSASGSIKLDLPAIADIARRFTALIVCQ